MKKIYFFILFLLIVLAVTSCGDDNENSSSGSNLLVTITSPTNNYATISSNIIIFGTASVDVSDTITKVEVSINSGAFQAVIGTNSWTYNANLSIGSNTFIARAISANGETNISGEVTIYYNISKAIYVAADGSDSNNGFFSFSPVQSIEFGLRKALANNITNIYLKEGNYTADNGLNSASALVGLNITNIVGFNILGGWNNDYSAANGFSTLDGQNNFISVLNATNITNILFNRLAVTGGYSIGTPNERGGGLHIWNGRYCIFTNMLIYNNHVSLAGGGFYSYNLSSSKLYCTVSNNSAETGGGFYFTFGGANELYCTITSNASINGGGIQLYYSSDNTIHGVISSNIANEGAGVRLWGANNNEFASDCTIENNIASISGGGFWTNGQVTSVIWNGSWGAGNTPDNRN